MTIFFYLCIYQLKKKAQLFIRKAVPKVEITFLDLELGAGALPTNTSRIQFAGR